jgi:phosphate transport system substrate-binding protein
MTVARIVSRLGLIAAMLFGAGNAAASDTLRVGGVGAATAMLPHVFAAFDPSEKFKLEVIPGLGTTGGLSALAENVLDMAVSGRALKPDELAKGLTQRAAIRTPFGLVTSHSRPNDLKSSEIAGIFKAAKATWQDGSPVRIILRPKSDSDTAVLGAMFPDMAAAIEQARLRQDLSLAATDQDNADLAERAPGSLTASTLTQIKMEQRKLRFVTIDGIEPTLEHLERGTYPFAKTLYFVLPAKNSPVVERFIEFLLTPAGQAALKASGNLLVN